MAIIRLSDEDDGFPMHFSNDCIIEKSVEWMLKFSSDKNKQKVAETLKMMEDHINDTKNPTSN